MADKTKGGNSRAREQDRLMPIANVMRLMRKVLPGHAKIADDSKETIQECVSEFISFITSEANDRCQREQRRTITTEDIMWAMWKLGFDDYIEPLSLFLQKYREAEGDHRCRELLPSIKKEAKVVICTPSSSNVGGANDGDMAFDPHANSYAGVPIPFDPYSQYQL